jgi:hypothetical protein
MPLIFIIFIFILMLRPRTSDGEIRKGFYVVIIIGIVFVVGYWIIRIFIFPP